MYSARRNIRKQGGFTLMELLIVIAVLGLLLGMLIPRLGGITGDTVDTVCDSNNKGVRYFTQMYFNKHNALPGGLTNLINAEDGELPAREDPDLVGAEVMSDEFWTRNFPGYYALNADEVDELKALGITTVYNLQGVDRPMQRKTLEEGDYVMMMGLQGDGSTYSFTEVDGDSFTEGAVGNPFWLGRIMMAVNENSDLVSKGMIQASALCPGAVLNQDNFTHKEYIIILPRLAATVAATAATVVDGDPAETEIVFVDSSDTTGGRQVIFMYEAQEGWQFDVSCPEGHKWPDNDEDSWEHEEGLNA